MNSVLLFGLLALPFFEDVVYPVHIMVLNEPGCEGAEVLVDGQRRLTITEGGDVLHFKKCGWHTVQVRKQGHQSASVRFRATDWEQGSTTHFYVRCTGVGADRKLTLEIE